jgi:hypothetical protein
MSRTSRIEVVTEGSAAYPAVAEEPGASGGLAARPDPTCALSAGPIGRPKSGWCRLSSGGRFRLTLRAGGRWIRTIGPWRHAVGSVMENVDNLARLLSLLSAPLRVRFQRKRSLVAIVHSGLHGMFP